MSAPVVHSPADRWDLTPFFDAFDGETRRAFQAALAADVPALAADAASLGPIGGGDDDAWAALLVRYEDVLARDSHLGCYVGCLASADASDPRFTQAEAKLASARAQLQKVKVELRRALGGASAEAFAAFVARPDLAGTQHALGRLRHEARFAMPAALEGLAADLGVDGIGGWGRLYDVVSSKLTFEVESPVGTKRVVSMSQRRSLMADGDRRVRESAFRGGNVAWAGVGDVAAAALNHIAGTRHTLHARRGVAHFLDEALDDADMSRATLDAMMDAVKRAAPLARRALDIKARTMGVPAVSWFDMEAPLPVAPSARVPWARGVELVKGSFDRAYPSLGKHFTAMLERRWIEAEPRDDKRPGAYCTTSELSGDTRIFMTFQGSLGDVSTLAHEVGHAFHSENLRGLRVLAREYPMTLAETASTFAESLLADGLLADPSLEPAQRALLLGGIARDTAAYLLDIPTRFFFEQRFYEERKAGELDASRLCELMTAAQREVFGDALAPGGEDPWFWASKLHFFIPEVMFYNFPYTFGFLLSRGMYARYLQDGAAFFPRYEAFLRATGSGAAQDVAKSALGADLEKPQFWDDAIATLKGPIDELEAVIPTLVPTLVAT
jgi:oligoendopeptidase F